MGDGVVVPFADRGYVSDLVLPGWMAFAIRLCRDGEDGLARYFRQVPAEFVWVSASGRAATVKCRCGRVVAVPLETFRECPSADRWFARDGAVVWAIRLPVEQPDEAVA